MQGDPQIVDYLNRAIRMELTAIDEYWVEARTLSNLGFKKLAHGLWRDGKKAHRKQARKFIDRVLFLEGTPSMMPNSFAPGTSIETIFAAGLKSEMAIRALYAEAAKSADQKDDFVTEDLLDDALDGIERRIKKIEAQIDLINSVGVELYSQKKI